MKVGAIDSITPLTPQAFYVLLALAKTQDTGWGVIKTVRDDTEGTVELATGTLYPLLKRLARSGFVEALGPHPGSGPHGENHTYRLTSTGRLVLGWELDRYAKAVRLGSDRVQ